MGKQIVRQPNGRFAIWSSVVEDFTVIDCTRQEVIDEFVEASRREITTRLVGILAALDRGEKPYHQFTQSFDECVAEIRERHGDDAESLKLLGLSS